MSRAVPKFGSYTPKSAPANETPPSEASSGSLKGQSEYQKKVESHSRRKHEDLHRQHRSNSDFADTPKPGRRHRDKQPLHVSGEDSRVPENFVIDFAGDLDNLTYESLHRYNVSKYARLGYGRVLGLERRLRVVVETSTHSQIVLDKPYASIDGAQERPLIEKKALLSNKKERRIRRLPPDQLQTEEIFIRLGSGRKRKRGTTSPAKRLSGLETTDSLHLSANDDGFGSGSSDDSDQVAESDRDTESRPESRLAELAVRIRQGPANKDLWQTFIDRQIDQFGHSATEGKLSSSQRQALAQLRIGLYDRAIAEVEAGHRSGLLIRRLAEGAKVWDTHKQQSMWKAALASYPFTASLWTSYIDFALNHPENTYEKQVDTVKSVLREIDRCRRELTTISDAGKEDLGGLFLQVLATMTRIMRHAGYDELAIAIWQGMTKLHLQTSDGRQFRDRLASLEEDWDLEIPRFGENNIQDATVSTEIGAKDNEKRSEPNGKIADCSGGVFASFAKQEQQSSLSNLLPGKTTDGLDNSGESTDAMHVILFSDIGDYLSVSDFEFSPSTLTNAFLAFFGMPSLPVSRRGMAARAQSQLRLFDSVSTEYYKKLPVDGAVPGSGTGPSIVTCNNIWSRFMACPDQPAPILKFLHNALEAFLPAIGGVSPKIHLLAFLSRFFPTQALKRAKTFLKKEPSDLHLYNASAHIETALGNAVKAEHIRSSATGMVSSSTRINANSLNIWSSQRHDFAVLIHDWTKHELFRGHTESASSRLLMFRDQRLRGNSSGEPSTAGQRISASARLSLEPTFRSGLDSTIHDQSIEYSIVYASMLSILAYLTADNQLPSLFTAIAVSISIIDNASRSALPVSEVSSLKIAIHESAAELVTHHMDQRRPFRPADISLWLTAALDEHRSSEVLLRLWSRLNSSLSIIDDIVKDVRHSWLQLDEQTPLVTWMLVIERAIDRGRSQGEASVSAEPARSLFKKALENEDSHVRASPSLWGMWMDFEMRIIRQLEQVGVKSGMNQVMKQTEQVRAVFFGGAKAIPWHKGWILRGLQMFDTREAWGMNQDELRAIYDLLFERDLRVRREIADQ